MAIESIKVPDIGGAEGVDVIELCVAVGDTVEAEDSLIVLETDKASMDIPAPVAGKIVSLRSTKATRFLKAMSSLKSKSRVQLLLLRLRPQHLLLKPPRSCRSACCQC